MSFFSEFTQDHEWLRQSFLVSREDADTQRELLDMAESADFKFTDTTLGGSFAINPPPQFTRYADRKIQGLLGPTHSAQGGISPGVSRGMGRYYSEALDDHGQYIHMRFGVPKFNSLTNFFFNFYNPQASTLARTGRYEPSLYSVGRSAGRAVGFVVTLPAQPLIWAGGLINFLKDKPVSRFYYLKPAMPMYWSAVSTMVNMIGVNMGIVSRGMSDAEAAMREDEQEYAEEDFRHYHEVLGDVYRKDGGIDIYQVATRAQRLAARSREKIAREMGEATDRNDLRRRMLNYRSTILEEPSGRTLDEYLEEYHTTGEGSFRNDEVDSLIDESFGEGNGTFAEMAEDDGFLQHMQSELEDGSQFITFRVDDPGPVSESFSNTVGESNLANKINGTSSSARSTRFDFAGGNLGDGPILGTIQNVVGSVKGFIDGMLESVSLSGLAALGGSAFVDIPKHWQSSTANLPRANYTVELRSPYGNPMSRYMNLVVPLSMLLAGALPISTGKHSYTSPFLVELYSKGRNQIRLGMIDSLSITRGTGNVGWTPDAEPLGIDVNFSVVDLSTIMHMPVAPRMSIAGKVAMGFGDTVDSGINTLMDSETTESTVGRETAAAINSSNFDDDNAFSDYMAVLGSLSLTDQIYPTNKLRIRREQRMAEWEQWKSPAHHANWLMGGSPARMLRVFTNHTDRGD